MGRIIGFSNVMTNNNTLKIHIGYWLSRLRNEVHHAFEERLAAFGITVPAWCIMVTIFDQKASSISELAQYIEVDKGTISRVVEKLVVEKLLIHKAGKDRRSGSIELTLEAKELMPKLIAEAKQNEKQFFGHLTDNDVERFRQIMNKIVGHIPGMTLDGWLLDKKQEK